MSFLKLLATLLQGLLSLKDLFVGLFRQWKADQEEKSIQEGRELAAQIKEAKTDAERAELLKKLSSHDGH